MVAAAVGAYLHVLLNIGGFLTTVACVGSSVWLLSTPPFEEACVFFFCLVMDVQQVDFVASLGVAFVVDWVFFIGRVVGNGQD